MARKPDKSRRKATLLLPGQSGRGARVWRVLRTVLLIGLLGLSLGVAAVAGLFLYYTSDPSLPTIDKTGDYHPKVVTRVQAADGQLIGEIFEERRTVIPRERIPRLVIDAFVDAEDAQFFEHGGINYMGMARALLQALVQGTHLRGASTLTQQLVKTYVLKSSERSLKRKVQEMYLSLRLEKKLSKEEILWLYLNQIYFGHGRYGIEEAARYYFGKSVTEVNAGEAAVLASLPKAPEEISPRRNPERTKLRQRYVLSQMARYHHLTQEEAIRYAEAPIRLVAEPAASPSLAPEFVDLVEKELVKRHGQDKLAYLGQNVRTSCDLAIQRAAREALESGLRRLDERNGYRGALRHLSDKELPAYLEQLKKEFPSGPPVGKVLEAVVQKVLPAETGPKGEKDKERGGWVMVDLGATTGSLPLPPAGVGDRYSSATRPISDVLKPGDVIRVRVVRIPREGPILALENGPQGAVLVLDPESRHILAMVGGYGQQRGYYNRALRAKRQPGSAFKSFVFATAFESKLYTPASILNDSPQVYDQPDLRAWAPKNAGEHNKSFIGPVRLRTALALSLNTVASQLIYDLKPEPVIRMAHALGIESPLENNYSLALGSSEVTLLELTNAYATLAARGRRGEPLWLLQVGEEQPQKSDLVEAVTSDLAFVMSSVLQSVIEEGTGASAKGKLKRPAAGKTGTSNDNKDAWFIGYTPNLAAGVWVGFDEPRTLGKREQGALSALPIWVEAMQAGLRDRKVELFVQPAGVVVQRIDPQTGKLAAPGGAALDEVFLLGTEPKEQALAPGEADPDKAIQDNN
jgi:penicillin-binding protein 1A